MRNSDLFCLHHNVLNHNLLNQKFDFFYIYILLFKIIIKNFRKKHIPIIKSFECAKIINHLFSPILYFYFCFVTSFENICNIPRKSFNKNLKIFKRTYSIVSLICHCMFTIIFNYRTEQNIQNFYKSNN